MPQHQYDIITVDGGLAGATLAKAMAENGGRAADLPGAVKQSL